ncbi:integrase core domain-containing protein [Parasedimentitalea psychrophila]|uniref:integrase core domain-containing protein n=1 Tax=Parasedimentitalea psychrophila TaxID=2997337 RepID=UPI0036F3C84E
MERLWRSPEYECVYLHAWESGSEAKAGVRKWIEFYTHKRPHSALGGQPPWFTGRELKQPTPTSRCRE